MPNLPCVCIATDERFILSILQNGLMAGVQIGTSARVDMQMSPVDKLDPRYKSLGGREKGERDGHHRLGCHQEGTSF